MTSPARPVFDSETRITIPETALTLPALRHPDHAEIERANQHYIRNHLWDLYRSEEEARNNLHDRHAQWACLANPNGDTERVRYHAYWVSAFFLIDDVLSDPRWHGSSTRETDTIVGELVAVLEGDLTTAGGEGGPYKKVAVRVLGPILEGMGSGLRTRFLADMRRYIQEYRAEVALRATGRVPDFDTYMAMHTASGCDAVTTLVEYGLQVDLTEAFRAHPALYELKRIVHDNFILVNDLFSFHREHSQGDYTNALSVLVLAEGMQLQDAIDKVCHLIGETEKHFIQKSGEMLASTLGADPNVRAYVEEMAYAFSASSQWSYETPRYHNGGRGVTRFPCGSATLTRDRMTYASAK
ncbi:terpene synthase family protein (plasmid) [Streptomyces sp. NBC_00440]|uniref:terpene synthase family protein n=1 Tax=unclassified Streptomyces TaxID=2593676 RepID=UPI002E2464C7|nr:terpene synthase family protein [Streptomyces sp. NBC_00963]